MMGIAAVISQGVAAANGGFSGAIRIPGKPKAWRDRSMIGLNTALIEAVRSALIKAVAIVQISRSSSCN